MWMLKWLGIAALLIVLLGLSMLNLGQQVDLDLYFWKFPDLPLILVIFESFILGMLTWFLVAFVNEMKIRSELRTVKRQRDEMSRELQALRNQPLEGFEGEEGQGSRDEDE